MADELMATIEAWLKHGLLGNPVTDWGLALLVLLGTLFALYVLRYVILRRLRVLAHRTGARTVEGIIEIATNTRLLFLLALSVYAASLLLELPARSGRVVTAGIVIVLIVQAGLWGNQAIRLWIEHYRATRGTGDGSARTTTAIVGFIGRLLLWSVVALMLLDNLGINVTALVASLGIGGIAVALAAQNILGDIFASLSIAIDKPFVTGDFIIIDGFMGTVEYIGLKTTRLRSLSGEQIIFANTDLLKSRVRNYKRMNERRVVFQFGVIYRTKAEQLERIPGIVRGIIESRPHTRFDRAHFWKYGDSSLDFEVVYYVTDREYNLYMDVQQAINLALFRRFTAEGIEFAYPTRTVYLARQEGAT
jgi:small-conductance mechanosensitive channel